MATRRRSSKSIYRDRILDILNSGSDSLFRDRFYRDSMRDIMNCFAVPSNNTKAICFKSDSNNRDINNLCLTVKELSRKSTEFDNYTVHDLKVFMVYEDTCAGEFLIRESDFNKLIGLTFDLMYDKTEDFSEVKSTVKSKIDKSMIKSNIKNLTPLNEYLEDKGYVNKLDLSKFYFDTDMKLGPNLTNQIKSIVKVALKEVLDEYFS